MPNQILHQPHHGLRRCENHLTKILNGWQTQVPTMSEAGRARTEVNWSEM